MVFAIMMVFQLSVVISAALETKKIRLEELSKKLTNENRRTMFKVVCF